MPTSPAVGHTAAFTQKEARMKSMFSVSCANEKDCGLMVPNTTHIKSDHRVLATPFWTSAEPARVRSSFLFGRLPKILRGARADLTIGTNPGLAKIPPGLVGAFPSGKWLVVAWHGSIAILDGELRELATAQIHFRHGDKFTENGQVIGDPRILQAPSGEIIMSFSGYALVYEHSEERDWLWDDDQLIAPLRLMHETSETGISTLSAYIDRHATRVISECPEKGMYAPGPKKNFGFFVHSRKVYALDFIYPTTVGEVDLAGLNDSRTDVDLFISKLCYGLMTQPVEAREPEIQKPPWSGIQADGCSGLHKLQPHNGPNPIWIEEIGEYLGIGHFNRGCAHSQNTSTYYPMYGHHYTFFFFTLSGRKPFHLTRVGNSEFCMLSQHCPSDCDIIQFIVGLARDGDEFLLSYGANDRDGHVMRVAVRDVLTSLVIANSTSL